TRLWAAKVFVGLLLVLGQAAWLIALLVLLQLLPDLEMGVQVAVITVVAGLSSFSWGLLTSAFCRRVLTATILALLFYLFACLLSWGVPFLIGSLFNARNLDFISPLLVLGSTIGCLLGSWYLFCQPYGGGGEAGLLLGWKSMLWLSWRQSRGLG